LWAPTILFSLMISIFSVLFKDFFIQNANTQMEGGICDDGANLVLWQDNSTCKSG
jgi:hypothetical protein